ASRAAPSAPPTLKPPGRRTTMSQWRRCTFAALAALMLAGCVKRGPPGVGVQKLAADIVFGVKPATDTPPPNLEPGQAGPGDATTYAPDAGVSGSVSTVDGGPVALQRPRSGPRARLTPLQPVKSTCPPAALTAFPAKEAGITVDGVPAEGQYRWKRQGAQTVPTLPGPPIPAGVSAGDPERGISLVKLQRVDAEGNTSEISFSPGVLYLPLEIQTGEQFTSVGIDPRTGSVLENKAKVLSRERVDA